MKILIVLTSHQELGNTGTKTGLWLEELAAPYYRFKDAGAELTLASPQGGPAPVDPKSNNPSGKTDAVRRFQDDPEALRALAQTRRLAEVSIDDFDAVFYPGGHGPLWDLAEDARSKGLIEAALAAGKPVAAVCHAPAVFRHAKTPGGRSVVHGKKVTGFTNTEEAAAGLTEVVPFLVQEMLEQNGGQFSRAENWKPHVVTDGLLITGQNPASSEGVADALLAMLRG